MSDPGVSTRAVSIIRSVPLLDFHDGYWLRAGQLRAELRARGFKAGVPDCLIAQSCLDHDLALITYDRDFRHFAVAGLQLR